MSTYPEFADLLKRVALLKVNGEVNQSAMERETGISRTTIGTWVRGERLPTDDWETLLRWLDARVGGGQADPADVEALRREYERHNQLRSARQRAAGHRLSKAEAPRPRDWRARFERHLVLNERGAIPTVLPWEDFDRHALRLPRPRESGFPAHIRRQSDIAIESAIRAASKAFDGRQRFVVVTSDTGGKPPHPGTSSNSGLTHAALHALSTTCVGADLLAIKKPSSASALEEFADAYRYATARREWKDNRPRVVFLDDVHRLLAHSDLVQAVDILTYHYPKDDGRPLTHAPIVVATCPVDVVDNPGQHLEGVSFEERELLKESAVRVPVQFDPVEDEDLDRAGVLVDRPYVIQRLAGPADLEDLVAAAQAHEDQTRWAVLRALAIARSIGGVSFERLAKLVADLYRQQTGLDLSPDRLHREVASLAAPPDVRDLPAVATVKGSVADARWLLSRDAAGLLVPDSSDGTVLDMAERHRMAEWMLSDARWDPLREVWHSAERAESALDVVVPGAGSPFGSSASAADDSHVRSRFRESVRALRDGGPWTVTQTAVLAATAARTAISAFGYEQALHRLAAEARDRPVVEAAVAALHLERVMEVEVETENPDGEPVGWTEMWPNPDFAEARAAYLRAIDAGADRLWRLLGDLELLTAFHPREGTFDGPVPAASIHAYAAAAAAGDAVATVRLAACFCGGPWDDAGEMSRGQWWPSGNRDIADGSLAAAAQLIREAATTPGLVENAEDLPPWLPWVLLALVEHLRGRVEAVEDAARRALALGLPARYAPVDHAARWAPRRFPDDVGWPAAELLERLPAEGDRSLLESLAHLLPDPHRHIELLRIARDFADYDSIRAHLQRAAQQGDDGAVVGEALRLWEQPHHRSKAKWLIQKTVEDLSSQDVPGAKWLGPSWATQVAGWLYLQDEERERSLGDWILQEVLGDRRLEPIVGEVVWDQANIDLADVASVWPPPTSSGLLRALTGIDEPLAIALEIWVIEHRLSWLAARDHDPSHDRAAEHITGLRARLDQVDRNPERTLRRLTDLRDRSSRRFSAPEPPDDLPTL